MGKEFSVIQMKDGSRIEKTINNSINLIQTVSRISKIYSF